MTKSHSSRVSRTISASPSNFVCCVCCKPLDGELFSFGGSFACQGCVSEEYGPHGPERVAEELRLRQAEAAYILRRHRTSRVVLSHDREDL
jgi:hypothetical protein